MTTATAGRDATSSTADGANVLIVVPWDQAFGGVASVVGNLGRTLEAAGHEVIFFHPGESERCRPRTTEWGFRGYTRTVRRPFMRGHPIKSVVAFALSLPVTLYQLAALIRRHRIRVINIHYPLDSFVCFAILRWLLRVRLVVSLHGADLFPEGRRRARYACSLRWLLRSADAVVTPSAGFLQDVMRVFPEISARSRVIHNGVDLAELSAPSAGGTGGEQPSVLCIAAHREKKAVDVLLVAFADVARTRQGVRLVLVGDGPLRAQHEARARALGVESRVAFLGERDRSEVIRLLHACTVLVLPSRSEPFGVVVTEALACGTPVIATAVGGVPEIIEDGTSGVLVAPDDPRALARAIIRLLEDAGLRERLAASGRDRVRNNFSCSTTGARYAALYRALLGHHGGRQHLAVEAP